MTIRSDLEAAEKRGRKISKQKAGYGGGMKSAHCAICRHFQSPDACEYVAGEISPQGWCRYFESKKRSS